MKTNKIFNGLFWSFTDNFLQQIVNFIVGIILARLLLPEEFGLIGILSGFIALANTIVNSGLSDALINKISPTEKDYNTVFWSNVLIGIVLYLILFLVAPYIAIYFNITSISDLLRISGISIVIFSFSSIHRTILTKKIDFKTITFISIVSVFISGIVALYMALHKFGVLSLVVRMVLGQFITLILFWALNTWRPKFIFDFESFKNLSKYGSNLLFSRLLNSIYDNIYYFVIGKFFSPASLGYYTRAEIFKNLASNNITSTVQRVSFSTLSAKSDDKSQTELFNKFLSSTFFITCFLMTLLFIDSKEIITMLIGEKWVNSIPYLKILSISGLFIPLYTLNINFLAVKNKTHLSFRLEAFTKLFVIPTIIIGIYFGITAMLFSICIASFFIYISSVYTLKKIFQFSYKDQLTLVFKGILLVLISLIATYVFTFFKIKNLYSIFFMNSTLVLIVYLLGLLFLFPELVIELKKLKK